MCYPQPPLHPTLFFLFATLTLTTLLVSLGLFTLTPSQAEACGIITSSVPRGYGVPQNFFSGSRELTVNAECDDTTFQPIVGSSRTDASNFAVYTLTNAGDIKPTYFVGRSD